MEDSIGQALVLITVLPVAFIGSFWIIKSFFNFLQNRKAVKLQSEFQMKLLDKYSNAPELLEYLKSDVGPRFIDSPVASPPVAVPFARILGSIQVGVVLSFLGAAFIMLRGSFGHDSAGFALLGSLALALGLGFVVSGALAYYLSKKWGLIDGQGSSTGSDDAGAF